MDNIEAIRRLKEHMHIHHIGEYPHIHLAEAFDMAVDALKEKRNNKPRIGEDFLTVTYDCSLSDYPTLCIGRIRGDNIKILNMLHGDEAFGMYHYLIGNAEWKERQGKWKLNKDGSGTCDQCNRTPKNVWDYDNYQNYCGHCGAKMSI